MTRGNLSKFQHNPFLDEEAEDEDAEDNDSVDNEDGEDLQLKLDSVNYDDDGKWMYTPYWCESCFNGHDKYNDIVCRKIAEVYSNNNNNSFFHSLGNHTD